MPIGPPSNINVPSPISEKPILPSSMGPKRSGIRVILMIIVILLVLGAAVYYFLVYSEQNEEKVLVNTELEKIINSEANNNASNSNANFAAMLNSSNNIINVNNSAPVFSLPGPEELDEINDADGDGLLSGVEPFYGTSPDIADTDKDGYDDFTEVSGCYNPTGAGKMTMSLYDRYCHNFFDNHVNEGMITNTEADALCELWTPYIQKIIDREEGVSVESILMEFDPIEYENNCAQFNEQYDVSNEDDEFTICDMSLFIALNFCHIDIYDY